MSVDLTKELKGLLSDTKDIKYRQVLISIPTNPDTAKELLNGIAQDNAKILQGLNDLQNGAPEKVFGIKSQLSLLQNLIKRIIYEIEKAPYSHEYMIKLCVLLVQTKNLMTKALSKLNNKTILERIRDTPGKLKKFFFMLGLVSTLSTASPKTDNPINNTLTPNKNNSSLTINRPTQMTTPTLESKSVNNPAVNAIIGTAQQQLGKPYKFGAIGPNAFDCSGFVQYVYEKHGIIIPKHSTAQAMVGDLVCSGKIDSSKMIPGDLIFFNKGGRSAVNHVGMYVGSKINDKGQTELIMIHAPRSGKTIRYENVNKNYWEKKFVRVNRVLGVSQLYASR